MKKCPVLHLWNLSDEILRWKSAEVAGSSNIPSLWAKRAGSPHPQVALEAHNQSPLRQGSPKNIIYIKSAVSLESSQQASFLQIPGASYFENKKRLSRRSSHSQQSPSQRNPGVVALLKSDGRQSPDMAEHRQKHQNSTSTDDFFGTKHRDHWSVCNDDPELGWVVGLLRIFIKQGFEYCVFRTQKRFQLIESGKNYLILPPSSRKISMISCDLLMSSCFTRAILWPAGQSTICLTVFVLIRIHFDTSCLLTWPPVIRLKY